MHNFQTSYDKILEVLRTNVQKDNFIQQNRKPQLSDIELIAIDLTAQYMSIDSEHQLYRVLRSIDFDNLIDRTVDNRITKFVLYFQDESRFGLMSHLESCISAKGVRPVINYIN